jgi:hypothetical protein
VIAAAAKGERDTPWRVPFGLLALPVVPTQAQATATGIVVVCP